VIDYEIRPIADSGILVEFGDAINDEIHQTVLNFDDNVSQSQMKGFVEAIPAYASVYIGYDPLVTDYVSVCEYIKPLIGKQGLAKDKAQHWKIPTCYEGQFAPDLSEVAQTLNMSEGDVINHHISGQYKVYMYGFAPGYAYLGGVPDAIQIPRKQAPQMNIPKGAVMIAGPQSLITTVVMPTGWWVIGRTAKTPLQTGSDKPFLFNVGDSVEFVQLNEADFLRQSPL
jgi:inhibitor of KinA